MGSCRASWTGVAAKRIPFIAFRGVSDGRGDPLMLPPNPYLQFVVYQQLAADNAAAATLAYLAAWRSGPAPAATSAVGTAAAVTPSAQPTPAGAPEGPHP